MTGTKMYNYATAGTSLVLQKSHNLYGNQDELHDLSIFINILWENCELIHKVIFFL